MQTPALDDEVRRRAQALDGNLADAIARHARERPDAVALIEHDTAARVTWKQLDRSVDAFAARLLSMGLRKGDVVATWLPMLKEHVYLLYACYRVGLIAAPLDLRLKARDVQHCFSKMQPKAFFFLGKTPVIDFRPMVAEMMKAFPDVPHWIQVGKPGDEVVESATPIAKLVEGIKLTYVAAKLLGRLRRARAAVGKRDACLIVFTTGSTGSPKAALLSHENVLSQNLGIEVAFGLNADDRMVVNLPASHVGALTEQLASSVGAGATSVLLHVFDAKKTMEAIAQHRCTALGQIPALFNLEWRLPEYANYDTSSLRLAIYGGQSVSSQFLERLQKMARAAGTGYGLTEAAGLLTYVSGSGDPSALVDRLGHDSPLSPVTIRAPMTADHMAGRELPRGEIGEICFCGAQVFLGYLRDEAATARALTKDGVFYTGDLGRLDDGGLRFAGRARFVIKPKGYQVFPGDVEEHISKSLKERVGSVACVGVAHEIYSEAIVAFVEAPGPLGPGEVIAACLELPAYARPSHVEVVAPGSIPLNRVAKTDYMTLQGTAHDVVQRLKAEGRWS